MVSNALLFLRSVLMVFPTWMGINYDSSLREQYLDKPKGYHQVKNVIKTFMLWRIYWIVCGIVLKYVRESFFEGVQGTIILSLMFLLPMVFITDVGLNKKI